MSLLQPWLVQESYQKDFSMIIDFLLSLFFAN